MSTTNIYARKTCKKCLKYVNIYITCFKCDAIYHIYCWKEVCGAYVNQTGQLFCCDGLTSNCVNTKADVRTQDNLSKRVVEKANEDGCNEDLENCPIKTEFNCEWNEFKCNACLLEFENEEYLENHYSECSNKEGEFVKELRKNKDLENCPIKEEVSEWNEFKCDARLLDFVNEEPLENHYSECPNREAESIRELKEDKAGLIRSFCNEENFQKESYEEHIKQGDAGSSSSRLNEDEPTCITNTEGNPAQGYDREKIYKPTICNYSTPIKECVVKHIGIDNDERSFKCNLCDYTAKDNETLKSHFSLKHYDGREKYDSRVCTFTSPSGNVFGNHRRIQNSEGPIKCDWCDYTGQRINLQLHIKAKHSKADKYKCRDCQYSAYRKSDLVRHERIHTNERPFKCDICDYTAAQKKNLNVHVKVKHSNADKEYKCRDCEYSAHKKANLIIHIRTHTNEKPFKCDMCDYAAAGKTSLSEHIKVRHSNADKEYKCKECGYSTYRKQNLARHIRTHTNERPF